MLTPQKVEQLLAIFFVEKLLCSLYGLGRRGIGWMHVWKGTIWGSYLRAVLV